MKNITKKQKSDVQTKFKWRTAQGEYLLIEHVGTQHLFNILKMIWNNFMPSEARIYPLKLYNFNSYYSDEYMRQAIKEIIPELMRRDLNTWQLNKLREMKRYFYNMYSCSMLSPERHKIEDGTA